MTDRQQGYGVAAAQAKDEHNYATIQEAEAFFFKLLKRVGVQADWSWEQTVKAAVRDPSYKAIQDPKDRKTAYERYIALVRAEEKDREKERQAKLREDFVQMLRSHPEITYYTRWATARPFIEGEMVFKAAKHEDERVSLFNDFRSEQFKKHVDQEMSDRRVALDQLSQLLQSLELSPLTRWSEAQNLIMNDDRYQNDDKMHTLTKLDIIKAFEAYHKALEEVIFAKRSKKQRMKERVERKNRDEYLNLLRELKSTNKITANTKWTDIHPLIEDDPRYQQLLGQSGSSPLELFWDTIADEEREMRTKRDIVYDVLEVSSLHYAQ